MSKHTKGKWVAERINCNWLSQKEKGMAFRIRAPEVNISQQDIAVSYDKPMFEEAQANASLIAAAPDLLEAAEAVVKKVMRAGFNETCLNDTGIHEAIAKAKGR